MAKLAKAAKAASKGASIAELAAQLGAEVNPAKIHPLTSGSIEKKVSSRATWTGTLAFSLLSIPVKCYTATEPDKIKFMSKQSIAEWSGEEYVAQSNGEGKKFDLNGTIVDISSEELDGCSPASNKLFNVEGFCPASQIDPIRIEKSWYIGPEKGGEHPFALLREGMVTAGKVGIAKFVSRGRDNVAYIRPYTGQNGEEGLVAHIMFYENEIRDTNAWNNVPNKSTLTKKEVELAVKLIDAMSEDFDPNAYHNEYVANVRRLIESKASNKPTPKVTKKEAPAASNDLMTTLMNSFEKAKSRKASKTK